VVKWPRREFDHSLLNNAFMMCTEATLLYLSEGVCHILLEYYKNVTKVFHISRTHSTLVQGRDRCLSMHMKISMTHTFNKTLTKFYIGLYWQ
jgi:hypothetical protein